VIETRTVLVCESDDCYEPFDVLAESLKPSPREYMEITGWTVAAGKNLCPSCSRRRRWDLLRAKKAEFIKVLARLLLQPRFRSVAEDLFDSFLFDLPPFPEDGEDAEPKIKKLIADLEELL